MNAFIFIKSYLHSELSSSLYLSSEKTLVLLCTDMETRVHEETPMKY